MSCIQLFKISKKFVERLLLQKGNSRFLHFLPGFFCLSGEISTYPAGHLHYNKKPLIVQ